MNIALITAGGCGKRMGQDIPKQFLNVYDKPIIIYTLEAFQRHPDIDSIVVVCLEGWEPILQAYCRQFGISKLESVVVGGENGQDSIRNGVTDIASRHNSNDFILVHDGNRPMVSEEVISDCIRVAEKCGNAISAIPCVEVVFKVSDSSDKVEQISRDNLKRTHTPHAASVGTFVKIHKEALEKGITASVATCALLDDLGYKIYFSLGSEKNIKLTTVEDIEMFKALLSETKEVWLKQS